MTQDLTKIKNPNTPFCRHWSVGNMREVSAKTLKGRLVGGRQNFQIFR